MRKLTKKESLLLKAMNLENEARAIKGEKTYEVDTTSYVRFIKKAQDYKVYELEERIVDAERDIERAEKEVAEKAWLETEDGKAYTTRLASANNRLNDEYEARSKEVFSEIDKLIKTRLGKQWGICYIDETSASFGIKDESKPLKWDGTINEIFGHSFDVIFKRAFRNQEELSINYGSMGSFYPSMDTSRVEFLQGLAKFAADKELQAEITRINEEFTSRISELNNEIKAIEATKMAA